MDTLAGKQVTAMGRVSRPYGRTPRGTRQEPRGAPGGNRGGHQTTDVKAGPQPDSNSGDGGVWK